MTHDELLAHGNHYRSISEPEKALACYAQAFIQNPDMGSAYNNYGNVVREMGYPERAIGFLLNAIAINEKDSVAQFNLAVAYLLSGDLQRGWKQYEKRWQFEHLDGKLPKLEQPRWEGQDLKGKTIIVTGEQGHGDNIQFCRFAEQLVKLGANVVICIEDNLKALLVNSFMPPITVLGSNDILPAFDYWSPIMSLPGYLDITYANLPHKLQYLAPSRASIQTWQERLGKKIKLRVGFCWSGRRDSWINQHKAMPFNTMLTLIKSNPDYEWYNLQADCTAEEEEQLVSAGVRCFPGGVNTFADTAALVTNLDVVISVDTAAAHLAAALGKPTWIMLNNYAPCWRWLLNRDDTPWYATARLFRQPKIGDWDSVVEKIRLHLKLFKI